MSGVFQFKTKWQGDKMFTGAKGERDVQITWYDDDGTFKKSTYSHDQVQGFFDNGVWFEMPTAPSWYFPGPGDGGKSDLSLFMLDLSPLEPSEDESKFGGVVLDGVWLDEAAGLTINEDLANVRSVSVSELREFSARTGYRVEVCEDFYTFRKEGLEDVYTVESLGGLIAVMDAIELLHNAVDRG